MADWLVGWTDSGRSVRIPEDPYLTGDPEVWIDGERAQVGRVSRLRDGGSTTIPTDRGTVRFDARLGRSEHVHTLDGEPLASATVNQPERSTGEHGRQGST